MDGSHDHEPEETLVNGRSECYDIDRAEFDRIVARLRDVDQRSAAP